MGRKIVSDKKVCTGLTLNPSTIKVIDENRGQTSRSAFVDELIVEKYEKVVKMEPISNEETLKAISEEMVELDSKIAKWIDREEKFPEIDELFSNLTSIELRIFDLINKAMLVKPYFLLLEIYLTIRKDVVKLETDDIDKYSSRYPGTLTTDDDDSIYFVLKLATRDCFKRLCKVGVLKYHDRCGNTGCFEHNTFCATQDETYSECVTARVQYFRNYFMVR
jgi:hypothetical protein